MHRVIVARCPLYLTSLRHLAIRQENYFKQEAVSHSRRVSWSPHTTPKKQELFALLARSNFFDKTTASYDKEPYAEQVVEAHRARLQQDIYIYKYNVSAVDFRLRTP